MEWAGASASQLVARVGRLELFQAARQAEETVIEERVSRLERLAGVPGASPPLKGFAEKYVHLLASSWRVRAAILFVWLCFLAAGAPLYVAFPKLLSISIEPPPASPSGLAKAAYGATFDPDPIQVIVMMSAPRPLISPFTGLWKNESCGLCPFYPFFPFSNGTRNNVTCPRDQCGFKDRTLPAAAGAVAASAALHAEARVILDQAQCKYIFLSYWDLVSAAPPNAPSPLRRADPPWLTAPRSRRAAASTLDEAGQATRRPRRLVCGRVALLPLVQLDPRAAAGLRVRGAEAHIGLRGQGRLLLGRGQRSAALPRHGRGTQLG